MDFGKGGGERDVGHLVDFDLLGVGSCCGCAEVVWARLKLCNSLRGTRLQESKDHLALGLIIQVRHILTC